MVGEGKVVIEEERMAMAGEEVIIIGGTIDGVVVEAGNIVGVEAEVEIMMIIEMAADGGREIIADHALVVVVDRIPVPVLGHTRNHLVGVPPLVHTLHVLEAEVIQEMVVVAIAIIMISMITTKGGRRRIGGK